MKGYKKTWRFDDVSAVSLRRKKCQERDRCKFRSKEISVFRVRESSRKNSRIRLCPCCFSSLCIM